MFGGKIVFVIEVVRACGICFVLVDHVMPPVFGADGRTENSLRQVSSVCGNFFLLIEYFVISNSSKYKVL